MAQTLTVTKEKERLVIHIQGGTVVTKFDATKPFGSGKLRARYFLQRDDHYVFSKTTRVAANKPLEALLPAEDISDNPHVKELRIQKVAGGERLLKLDIGLLVEEMDNGKVVGDGGAPQTFSVLIEGRVAQLLEEMDHSPKEFAAHVNDVSPQQVGRLKSGQPVSVEAIEQLPPSIEAHKEQAKKKPRKLKLKRKKP